MKCYMYNAALYCEPCGEQIREDLTKQGKAPSDPEDEYSYDSDDFPKGPESSGESDSPSHCDGCAMFLENSLTPDGWSGLCEMIVDRFARPRTKATTRRGEKPLTRKDEDPMREWIDFYDVSVEDLLDWSES